MTWFPMRRFAIPVLAVSLLCCAAKADVVELRADEWCPFNCEAGSENPGFMVEIAREALALYGHDVGYEQTNWSRSIDLVTRGEANGVIGTDLDETPDLLMGPPLANYQEVVVFRSGETREITAPEDLTGLRLGGIQDYTYSDLVMAHIEDEGASVQLLTGEDALARNLKKLLAGRVDVIVEERSVVLFELQQLGLRDQVELVFVDEASTLHIAFSPALESSPTIVQQFHAGLERLVENGRHGEILAKYGLAE